MDKSSLGYNLIRAFILFGLITVAIVVIVKRDDIIDKLSVYILWMKNNPFDGPLTFTGLMFLGEVFFIPSTFLTVGAGFAFQEVYHNTC